MDESRWKQIDLLFDAALELPEAEREAFVSQNEHHDESVRKTVLELLKAEKESESFMRRSAVGIAAEALADERSLSAIPAPAFLEGQIANYRILRLLGAGGMGEVYLARDEKLERDVALKILPSDYDSADERVRRFELEARAISSLNHPGIVTIHDIGTFEGKSYIATEFVDGKTLRELINEKTDLRTSLSIAVQVCDALAAAHLKGIVHRDIKPENVMVRGDGYAKILDFGLAKLTGPAIEGVPDVAATKKGMIIGTPAYMSPSQIGGERVDQRTDLWSFGVVFYELLTGVNPFKGDDRKATFRAILTKDPEAASTLNPELPVELDRVIAKLLEKDPGMGYQTAADLKADLKRLKREMDSSPSNTGTSENSFASGLSRVRRNPLPYGALALAAVAALIAAYYFYPRVKLRGEGWANAKSVQLTFESGTEEYPSISPDGRSFVYASDKDGDYDIYLLRIGGSNEINLTEGSKADDTMPAFSPSGDKIAFRSDRSPNGIYVMGATGENPKRVADFGYEPSWSPDGKALVVATRFQSVPSVRTPSSLWIVNIESGEKRKVLEQYALQPSWSPDGSRIAFWYTENRGKRIVATVPVSGGEPVEFASESNTNWNPVWSHDGKYLYYASDKGGNTGFWRAEVDPRTGKPVSEPESVPTPAKFSRHLGFSADGKKLIYVQTSARSNLRAVPFDATKEEISSEPEWVTKGDFEFSGPELSKDGTFYVARLIKETQEDAVIIDATDGSLRDLTNDSAFDRYIRLSPDGNRIAYSSDRSGIYQVWLMDIDGGKQMQVTNSDSIASIPVWSPDGTMLTYDSAEQVFVLDIAEFDRTGKALIKMVLPKTKQGGFFRVWDWSPDGTLLAGNFDAAAGSGIGTYSLETKTFKRLTDFFAIPHWLPDSKRIIFSHEGRPMIADTATGDVRNVLPGLEGNIRNIAISVDGTRLYFTVSESESNIWLLDASAAE